MKAQVVSVKSNKFGFATVQYFAMVKNTHVFQSAELDASSSVPKSGWTKAQGGFPPGADFVGKFDIDVKVK